MRKWDVNPCPMGSMECKIRGKDHHQLLPVAVCAWDLTETRKNGEKELRQKAGAVVWERDGEFCA